MESKLVGALCLASQPVALFLTNQTPAKAIQFKQDGWGCVAVSMVAVSKGRTAVFDRRTFGVPAVGRGWASAISTNDATSPSRTCSRRGRLLSIA